MEKNILVLFIFFIIIIGCTNNNLDNTDSFWGKHCVITDTCFAGEYLSIDSCYYQSSGNIYAISMRRGLEHINEEVFYYPNGQIYKYAFYNPLGEQRFLRIYDKQGNLVEEYGDFYSHVRSNKTEAAFILGDTIILDFYIAAPPNTYYKIFWIDQAGRHEIDRMDTITPYLRRLTIVPDNTTYYILPHEVEFFDTIRGTKEVRENNISFNVIDRQ